MRGYSFFSFYAVALFCISAVSVGYAQGYQWENVAMGGGGFVSAVVTSETEENLIYARTDVGGAYRWDESSGLWIPLNDWVSDDQVGYLGIESIGIDPQNPNRVYMLAGISYFNNGRTAVLISDDYGETFDVNEVSDQFKAHGNGMGRQTGEKLAVDPNNPDILFCGTRWNGLFKSTDSGRNWEKVSSFPVETTENENGISFVKFDSNSGSPGSATERIFAGVSRSGQDNLYLSEDGGSTWNPVSGHPQDFMPQRCDISGDGLMYITYGNGAGPHGHWNLDEPMENGAVYRYGISDRTWQEITPGISSAYAGIDVHPENPDRVIVTTINLWYQQPWGYGDRIFVSDDRGESWTDPFEEGRITMDANGLPWITDHALHWAGTVNFDPFNPSRVFLTSGNGIFMTEDINAQNITMKFAAHGIEETVPLDAADIPGGPFISVIGDYDGMTYSDITVSAPGGTHSPGIGTTTGLDYAENRREFVVRLGGADDGSNFPIYYSQDTGWTWSEFSSIPSGSGTLYQGKTAVSSDGNSVLWSPSGSNTTYRTSDLGGGWTEVTGLSVQDAFPASDPEDPSVFYVYDPGSGMMYTSQDSGKSFSQAGSPGNNGYKRLGIPYNAGSDIWVALGTGGVARSQDQGESFSSISSVEACDAVGFGKPAPEQDYPAVYIWGSVNGVTGIFRSVDAGDTWIRVNDEEHQFGGPGNGQFVLGDPDLFGRVYMSTAGRGIVYGEPSDTVSLRHTEKMSGFGKDNRLSVVPGPGSHSVSISFMSIEPGNTEISVYRLDGSLVMSVGDFSVSSGLNTVELKTGSLAQGMYICRITTPENVLESRMMVLK